MIRKDNFFMLALSKRLISMSIAFAKGVMITRACVWMHGLDRLPLTIELRIGPGIGARPNPRIERNAAGSALDHEIYRNESFEQRYR